MSYQHKLDFGEGPECHEAYEEFLKVNDLEDNTENWVLFVNCWTRLLQAEAIVERMGKTIQ